MHDRTARPKRARGEPSRDIIVVADDGKESKREIQKTACVGIEI